MSRGGDWQSINFAGALIFAIESLLVFCTGEHIYKLYKAHFILHPPTMSTAISPALFKEIIKSQRISDMSFGEISSFYDFLSTDTSLSSHCYNTLCV